MIFINVSLVLSDFGKNLQLLTFLGKHVTFRRGEGSVISTGISPYPAILHRYVQGGRWDDAVRLCRFVKVRGDIPVWLIIYFLDIYLIMEYSLSKR